MAYNLANLLRTLALPGVVERWSLTSVRDRIVKIGAKVVSHGRYAIFQMAVVAMPRELLGRILGVGREAAAAGTGCVLTIEGPIRRRQ